MPVSPSSSGITHSCPRLYDLRQPLFWRPGEPTNTASLRRAEYEGIDVISKPASLLNQPRPGCCPPDGDFGGGATEIVAGDPGVADAPARGRRPAARSKDDPVTGRLADDGHVGAAIAVVVGRRRRVAERGRAPVDL